MKRVSPAEAIEILRRGESILAGDHRDAHYYRYRDGKLQHRGQGWAEWSQESGWILEGVRSWTCAIFAEDTRESSVWNHLLGDDQF